MTRRMRISVSVLSASLILAAFISACTQSSAPASTKENSDPSSTARTSTLTIKGSDTLVLLAQRLAERFMAENPGSSIQVTGGGSGTGIASLINGSTDIATASRGMKNSEKQLVAERRGSAAVETAVAQDGIAVYVHGSNSVASLSMAQLKSIYTGEITNWKEVGGPDASILLYGRENNSGTYAYFKEEVLEEEDFAAETQSLPGTAAVVNAVSRDPSGIGYGGIAYASGIRAVPIVKEAGAAPVEPTLESVSSGKYPISRNLYFYTAGAPTGQLKAFVDYALSDAGQQVASEVGYYPLPKRASNTRPSAEAK